MSFFYMLKAVNSLFHVLDGRGRNLNAEKRESEIVLTSSCHDVALMVRLEEAGATVAPTPEVFTFF